MTDLRYWDCPVHGFRMDAGHTKYGVLHKCSVPDCTYQCWDGPTSTPADATTRKIRIVAHCAFDALWKGHSKMLNRRYAYEMLSKHMGLPGEKTHIGMFDRNQCVEVLNFVTKVIVAEAEAQ